MYGGVDHRLEHRSRTVLRHVHPPRRLVCRDSRVALGEVDRVADLPVQRSGDRRGIVLRCTAEHGARVADRFNRGTADEFVGALRAEQDSGNSCAGNAAVVFPDQPELGELCLVGLPGARADETIDECRFQRVETRAADDLLVRAEQAGTPAPLKQATQRFGRQLTCRAALPAKVLAGAPVHERASLHVDDQHGRAVRQSQSLRRELWRRIDAVCANLADVCLEGIHHLAVHGMHFARVQHAESQPAAQRVAERGQFVRDSLAARLANAVAGEDNLLRTRRGCPNQAQPCQRHRSPHAHFDFVPNVRKSSGPQHLAAVVLGPRTVSHGKASVDEDVDDSRRVLARLLDRAPALDP